MSPHVRVALVAATSALAMLVLWGPSPPSSRANGERDEETGGHAHVPAPLEYADAHVPPSVWTDPAMIARGREIYTARCAVCHGDSGDGRGPAGQALPLKPPDFRDRAGVAEMRDNYWFWRVSEGGQVEPFKGRGSAMPPWKGELSVEDRWAVMAYQHTFSGHDGPHVPWEHPESVAVGRDIYAMACLACHGADGRGDGSVGPMLSPRRAPQPRDFTGAEFKFRSTPSGQLPTTADLFRTVTEGIRSPGGPMTIGLHGHRIMPAFRHMPEEQRLEVVEYVKSLNRGFWDRTGVRSVVVPPPPPATAERLARGRQLYADAECLACHGAGGRGDGPSAPTLRDSRGLPIAATDLTRPERFKNGRRPDDVYRTLMTGLAGTPMPSYADALDPDQAWDLVHFVLSLSDARRAADGHTTPAPPGEGGSR
ncbi:MAG TPA: c-type cytochrome [Candidatus Binatia bacterium]|nr:c-type cytochrome [Candidatus Binatia bacterium]